MGFQLNGIPIESIFENAPSSDVSFEGWANANPDAPYYFGNNVYFGGHSPNLTNTYAAREYGSSAGSGKLHIQVTGSTGAAGSELLSVYEMFAAKGSTNFTEPLWDYGRSSLYEITDSESRFNQYDGGITVTADLRDWILANDLELTSLAVISVSNPSYDSSSGGTEAYISAPTQSGFKLTSTVSGEAGSYAGSWGSCSRDIIVTATNDYGTSVQYTLTMKFRLNTVN